MSPAHAGNSKVNTSRPRFASGFCELSVHPAAVAPFPSLRSSLAPRVDALSVKTVHSATGAGQRGQGQAAPAGKLLSQCQSLLQEGVGEANPPGKHRVQCHAFNYRALE